jgi:hypothetical protein
MYSPLATADNAHQLISALVFAHERAARVLLKHGAGFAMKMYCALVANFAELQIGKLVVHIVFLNPRGSNFLLFACSAFPNRVTRHFGFSITSGDLVGFHDF